MTTLTRLTFSLAVVSGLSAVSAAPPTVSGNRPTAVETTLPAASQNAPASAVALALQPASETSSPQSAAPPRTAASELKDARERLLSQRSIHARIVESVAIYDRKYIAEGEYLQSTLKPGAWHMKLDMVLKVGESSGSLLEVCDGEVLWTSTQINLGRKTGKTEQKEQTVTRRNVTQILAAARKVNEQTEAALIASLGLGGVPALLAGIERDMQLTGFKDDTFRDRPVVIVQGEWNEKLAAQFSRKPPGGSSPVLFPFVPDSVQVFLDRETGFPHKFVFLKRMPDRNRPRAMLTLEFLDVSLNEAIDPSEFAYKPPPGVPEQELTSFYLDQLTPRLPGGPPAPPGR